MAGFKKALIEDIQVRKTPAPGLGPKNEREK